jgi:hypothetical protein
MLMSWCYLRMVEGPYSHLRGTQGNITGWNTDHLFLLLAGAFTGMENPAPQYLYTGTVNWNGNRTVVATRWTEARGKNGGGGGLPLGAQGKSPSSFCDYQLLVF